MRRRGAVAVVLAAGRGTRMRGGPPKVLETAAGRTLLRFVLDAVRGGGIREIAVVVGHARLEVAAEARAWAAERRARVVIVRQDRRLGSGHAVARARAFARGAAQVLVFAGDAPALRSDTVSALLRTHRADGADATLLCAEAPDPTGYGRVVLDAAGRVCAIVEEADARDEQRALRLVNTGAYCFETAALFSALAGVRNANAKREYYLTDVIGILSARGARLSLARCADWREAMGVNDPVQLAEAAAVLRRRILAERMRAGVRVDDPETTYVDARAVLVPPLRLRPQTHVLGASRIEAGCDIGPLSYVEDSRIGARTRVLASVVRGATVGEEVWIGPYAHLRPGTRIERRCKIGNFVEVKRSRLAQDVSAGHLAYLGDATVGRGVNVGAGTITANFDGKRKHATVVGEGTQIGSNAVLVAPVRIARRVTIGAGAVVRAGTKSADGATLVGVPARVLPKERAATPRRAPLRFGR